MLDVVPLQAVAPSSKRPQLYRTRSFQAMPKVYRPYVANTLKPIGSGLPDLIALGMDEPARTMEASSASSTPYGALFLMRSPPRPYFGSSQPLIMDAGMAMTCTRAPTVTPAAIEGTEPVRT